MDGVTLQARLTELGLSQRAAATLLGYSVVSVSKWVTGKASVPDDVAAKLAVDDLVPAVDLAEIEPEPIAPAEDALPVLTIVRRSYPHSGPWMQIQSINLDGSYLCWWQVDEARKTATYTRAGLETYAEAMAANRRTMPVFGVPIVSLPLKNVA